MKFFKNPVVAVLLSALIVIASTLGSVNIRFGAKCQDIADDFYAGDESMVKPLNNISASVDGLVNIAGSYGLDCSAVSSAANRFASELRSRDGRVDALYQRYKDLMREEASLESALFRLELRDQDEESAQQYTEIIRDAVDELEDSDYNESVRAFLRKYDHFPTNALAALSGVAYPAYFA